MPLVPRSDVRDPPCRSSEICRQGLEECGPAKVFRDNLRAVEMVWEGMDREGVSPSWKDVLAKEGGGGFVAFL